MSSVGGVALGVSIAVVAAVTPSVPQAVVDVIFVPAILVAFAIALPVIGYRMLFIRDKALADVPMTRWHVAYFLSAVPVGVATLLLGALTALAFVFKLDMAPDLAVSIVALVGVWVFFSLIVKVVLNAQLLLRQRAKP